MCKDVVRNYPPVILLDLQGCGKSVGHPMVSVSVPQFLSVFAPPLLANLRVGAASRTTRPARPNISKMHHVGMASQMIGALQSLEHPGPIVTYELNDKLWGFHTNFEVCD